uniref:START domain-containing protein n=1 Tax=Phytophthora ramorum TaxID=164328 RepID=H3HDD2_PHYRM
MASRSSRRSSADAAPAPKVVASRSSSPASGSEAVEDARKRKHRELVKRSYYQKLELLKELRQQEQALSTQHAALLRYVRTRPPVGGPSASVPELHEKYVQATSEKEQQMKENATLRHVHSQHLAFQKKLSAASANEEPAYLEVCNFRTSRDLYTANAEVLGWTHRYRLEGERLQYSICKHFPGRTAQELSERGWAIMTTESSYKALHSRGMTSNLHDIQTVNEDNRVFCRELQRPGQNAIMKTLLLSSRFRAEDGYMTIYRALDHDKFGFTGRRLEPRVVWLDMFAWTSFENRDDSSGVDFQFGGEMKHFSVDNAQFWMLEVLLMALRWESRAVGPLITLQG